MAVRYLAVDDERHLVVAVQVLAVLAHVRLEYFPHTLQPQPYDIHVVMHHTMPTVQHVHCRNIDES